MISRFHPKSGLVKTKNLRERNWGNFEGRKEADLDWDKIKFGYQKNFKRPPGGENLTEFYKRVKDFLDKIKREYPSKTILIVSHKNFIRTLIGIINQSNISEIHGLGKINGGKFLNLGCNLIQQEFR